MRVARAINSRMSSGVTEPRELHAVGSPAGQAVPGEAVRVGDGDRLRPASRQRTSTLAGKSLAPDALPVGTADTLSVAANALLSARCVVRCLNIAGCLPRLVVIASSRAESLRRKEDMELPPPLLPLAVAVLSVELSSTM